MKSELKLADHAFAGSLVPSHTKVVEIWYDGKMIGTVAGADGPGVRVITKHPLSTDIERVESGVPSVINVRIG